MIINQEGAEQPALYMWRGEPLPDPRPGYTYGFYLYPGGRSEVRQTLPALLQSRATAEAKLEKQLIAVVGLGEAEALVKWWAEQKNKGIL